MPRKFHVVRKPIARATARSSDVSVSIAAAGLRVDGGLLHSVHGTAWLGPRVGVSGDWKVIYKALGDIRRVSDKWMPMSCEWWLAAENLH